ncbi:GNAT family N-acetyltransferase [Andreprevotia chitinilytica]|uniref:GNAT family N-acetyltransferase n=1 Tax=Andreprevotia chitinilytica TaxID=396808 RepID=UPI00068B1063|nr:GNAT family N-acetyltransferase [Andreprevotia chitinilytica]
MQMNFTDPRISLRATAETDLPLLKTIYASTREEELKITDWSDAQKADFVEMQFKAQHHAYSNYPDATYFLILYDGEPVGRVYLQQRQSAILIIDLTVLTACRGRGIGGCILQAIFEQARELGKAVQIHVEKFNPALRLYHRLGFQMLEDKGVYLFLEWQNGLEAVHGI